MEKKKNQLVEKICPMCGKAYIFRDKWAYKRTENDHVVNYCSWTCFRKSERRKDGGTEQAAT